MNALQSSPQRLQGAPVFGAAKRTLDGEDCDETIGVEGKGGV